MGWRRVLGVSCPPPPGSFPLPFFSLLPAAGAWAAGVHPQLPSFWLLVAFGHQAALQREGGREGWRGVALGMYFSTPLVQQYHSLTVTQQRSLPFWWQPSFHCTFPLYSRNHGSLFLQDWGRPGLWLVTGLGIQLYPTHGFLYNLLS